MIEKQTKNAHLILHRKNLYFILSRNFLNDRTSIHTKSCYNPIN